MVLLECFLPLSFRTLLRLQQGNSSKNLEQIFTCKMDELAKMMEEVLRRSEELGPLPSSKFVEFTEPDIGHAMPRTIFEGKLQK